MQFTLSCNSCICEASLCIVSWSFLTFCTENSSTRNSWALFNSFISWRLLIWVSRGAVSFMTDSSCGRTNLLSSRFHITVMGVFEFQLLSISLLLKFANTSVKWFHLVFLLHGLGSRVRTFAGLENLMKGSLLPQNCFFFKKFASIGKCVLLQPILAWNTATRFPVLVGSWDELTPRFHVQSDKLSIVLHLLIAPEWSQQSTKLFVIKVWFRWSRNAFRWVTGWCYDWLVERQGSDT